VGGAEEIEEEEEDGKRVGIRLLKGKNGWLKKKNKGDEIKYFIYILYI
jgi:hypothetical protein